MWSWTYGRQRRRVGAGERRTLGNEARMRGRRRGQGMSRGEVEAWSGECRGSCREPKLTREGDRRSQKLSRPYKHTPSSSTRVKQPQILRGISHKAEAKTKSEQPHLASNHKPHLGHSRSVAFAPATVFPTRALIDGMKFAPHDFIGHVDVGVKVVMMVQSNFCDANPYRRAY